MLNENPQLAVKESFEQDFNIRTIRILPGEYLGSADAIAMATLLGSCVSVCLFDQEMQVGGMNHFMLPKLLVKQNATRCTQTDPAPCGIGCSARYGECALRLLLRLLEKLGARKGKLQAKIFGGGRVMAGGTDIGQKNIDFALGYLDEKKIPVIARDIGDCCPRKVIFFPATTRVFIKKLYSKPIGNF